MRKVAWMALLTIAGLGLATACLAANDQKGPAAPVTPAKQETAQKIIGNIMDVNAETHQISVQPNREKESVTITVNDVSNLMPGQHVIVTLKAGTKDQAESVQVMDLRKHRRR